MENEVGGGVELRVRSSGEGIGGWSGEVEGGEEWWMSGWRNRGVEGQVKGVVEEELVGGVEGGEEWWRSGWRNRGVEGRVKGVVEEVVE